MDKQVKYGRMSWNATALGAKGKESFIKKYLKKYEGKPIFANRKADKDKMDFLNMIWELIEKEAGVKSVKKEAVTGKQADK